MPHYRLDQPVPWDRLSRVLRWHLRLKLRCYRRARDTRYRPVIDIDAARRDVEESYALSRAVRGFLGYTALTKTEQEARRLLDEAETGREGDRRGTPTQNTARGFGFRALLTTAPQGGTIMNIDEILVRRIRVLCSQQGLSINRLATVSHVKQSTLAFIVKGATKNPRIQTLHKIANALGMTLAEFLDFQELNDYSFADQEDEVDT